MSAAYQAALAAKAAKSSGSRGGGSRGGGSASSPGGTSGFSAVDAYAASGGDPADYLTANYKALGYSTAAQANAAYAVYQQQNGTAANQTAAQTGMYNNLTALIDTPGRITQKLDDGTSLVLARIKTALKANAISDAQANELINLYYTKGGK